MTNKENYELIRTIEFQPYIKGPSFRLELYDVGRQDHSGKHAVGYRLLQLEEVFSSLHGEEDCHLYSPHAIDSDEAVRALMSFLTLRPGDTDADYFANYSERQHQFCREHAEYLGASVDDVLEGDDDA